MLLAVIVVLIVFWFIVNLRQFVVSLFKQISLDIPSFKSYPIFGHFWSFQGLKSQGTWKFTNFYLSDDLIAIFLDAFLETNKFSSDFPEISKLWQFHHLNIFVNSPKLIERVLLSKACLQRPLLLLKFFDVNEGLLSSRCKSNKQQLQINFEYSELFLILRWPMDSWPSFNDSIFLAQEDWFVHGIIFSLRRSFDC